MQAVITAAFKISINENIICQPTTFIVTVNAH
jgi:hypothetical protein